MNNVVTMRLFLVMLAVIALCLPEPVMALQVSIAPPTIDAGDMLPGESKSMSFYITTDHDNNLLVDISAKKPRREFYDPVKDKGRYRYSFVAENASEEDITGWVIFMDDSVVLTPKITMYHIEGGGIVNANKEVEFILNVPGDAEPGYHGGVVLPYPRISIHEEGTGLGIITVPEMGYVVNILGEARRDAEIAGISLRKDAPERGTLSVLVKNKGTVTISAVADQVRVFDSDNQTVAWLGSGGVWIEPGNIGVLEMRLDTRGMEGSYGISAHVEWMTGDDYVEDEIDVGEYVPAPEVTGAVVAPPPLGFPVWILPLILAAIGLLVYWRVR